MGITAITSISQLNEILSKDKDKLSVKCSLTSDITEIVLIAQVIDFHATWYGSFPLSGYVSLTKKSGVVPATPSHQNMRHFPRNTPM